MLKDGTNNQTFIEFCKAFLVLALTWRLLSVCDGWLVTPRAGTISVPCVLFDCGFQQKVELRNEDLLDVTATLPKAFKLKYDSVLCGSMFTSAA